MYSKSLKFHDEIHHHSCKQYFGLVDVYGRDTPSGHLEEVKCSNRSQVENVVTHRVLFVDTTETRPLAACQRSSLFPAQLHSTHAAKSTAKEAIEAQRVYVGDSNASHT